MQSNGDGQHNATKSQRGSTYRLAPLQSVELSQLASSRGAKKKQLARSDHVWQLEGLWFVMDKHRRHSGTLKGALTQDLQPLPTRLRKHFHPQSNDNVWCLIIFLIEELEDNHMTKDPLTALSTSLPSAALAAAPRPLTRSDATSLAPPPLPAPHPTMAGCLSLLSRRQKAPVVAASSARAEHGETKVTPAVSHMCTCCSFEPLPAYSSPLPRPLSTPAVKYAPLEGIMVQVAKTIEGRISALDGELRDLSLKMWSYKEIMWQERCAPRLHASPYP